MSSQSSGASTGATAGQSASSARPQTRVYAPSTGRPGPLQPAGAAQPVAGPGPDSVPQTHGAAREFDLRAIVEEVSAKARPAGLLPLFIAVLAAALALITMADGASDRAASVAQLEAANQFAWYQAKNIRQMNSQIAAAQFAAMGESDQAETWRRRAQRYEGEKGEILATARGAQAARAKFVRQGDYYSMSVAMLQIAIVLASAALVYRGYLLVSVSMALAVLAAFFAWNGYGLYYEIPADPGAAVDWFRSQALEL
ncbi:MAG: DUF4337 family protein, partial [Pseudomonadota bacterium]